MKKLGKLSINPERVMKNEELVNLRGGYGDAPCGEGVYYCSCALGMADGSVVGGIVCLGSNRSYSSADCWSLITNSDPNATGGCGEPYRGVHYY